MTPQKAQMAQKDSLDRAIDHVAARLTHVDDDPALASRIVAALPERVSWFGWWPTRVAAMGVLTIVLAYVVTNVRTTVSTNVPPVVTTNVPSNRPNAASNDQVNVATNDGPNVASNDRVNARLNDGPNEPDFERSLVAVAAPEPLDVVSLTPDALPAEGSIAIAPLLIADLPLTEEFARRE